MTRSGVFLTKFVLVSQPMKQSRVFDILIGTKAKAGYPNIICVNLMNY